MKREIRVACELIRPGRQGWACCPAHTKGEIRNCPRDGHGLESPEDRSAVTIWRARTIKMASLPRDTRNVSSSPVLAVRQPGASPAARPLLKRRKSSALADSTKTRHPRELVLNPSTARVRPKFAAAES